MAESLPSKRFVAVDVPEVKNFEAKFNYNFFVPDERDNDSGLDSPEHVQQRAVSNFDNALIDSINFRRFVPRLVRLSWKPTIDEERIAGRSRPGISEISITNNFDKIHNEQTFTTDDFTNSYQQDTNSEDRLEFMIQRVLRELRENQNSEEDESPLDIIKFIKKEMNSPIDPRFLTETFIKYSKEGYKFLDNRGREKIVNNLSDEVSKVRTRTQINNKVIEKILKTTSQNSLNLFEKETSNLLQNAKQIQQKAIADRNSTLLDGRDYDFEILDFINFRKVDPSTFDSTTQVIGYVVDKFELNNEGDLVEKEPLIIENPRANFAVDLKVRYGTTYVYSIRSIAFVELLVEDSDTNDIVALSFLLSSKPSEQFQVRTEEEIPPDPPTDFNVDWCVTNKAARLMWNFPITSQRDIKQFQVFRRSSVNEPFQLIKQFDFDNTELNGTVPEVSFSRRLSNETPNSTLIERLEFSKNFYIDREFTKDSKFIYAICAIDAHGFSSNYSTQFEVSFNRFNNKIEKKLVSKKGAPKAYPNAFLEEDTFVDTIKTSGRNKLKVVFNPEFLKLVDSENNDLELLKTDNESEYRIQLINVDIQDQQVVKVKLRDKRTTLEKAIDGLRFEGIRFV